MGDNYDFVVSVNKFFYYAMNYPSSEITYPTLFNGNVTEYLPSFFNAFEPNLIEHLWGKFKYFHEKYGTYGAIMAFYGELDGKNRVRMLNWINVSYPHNDTFGLSFEEVER